jgi:hypothetical protein
MYGQLQEAHRKELSWASFHSFCVSLAHRALSLQHLLAPHRAAILCRPLQRLFPLQDLFAFLGKKSGKTYTDDHLTTHTHTHKKTPGMVVE